MVLTPNYWYLYNHILIGINTNNIGINTVILGHSERRAYFNETDSDLAKKVSQALEHSIKVVFCFGEELDDRKSSNEESIVEGQLRNALFHLEASDFERVIKVK